MDGAGGSGADDVEVQGESIDERWEPAYRRELRREYREFIDETKKRRDEITLPDELIRNTHKLNQMLDRVVATREASIDSEGFRLLSAIGREQVESTHGELIRFDTIVYAEKLVTFMGGRTGGLEQSDHSHLDWARLGERALRVFKKAPTPDFLHGALEVQPVKKKERSANARSREKPGQTSRAREVEDFEDEEESTTKDVGYIFQCLKGACAREPGGKVQYFRFVVDPESFAHTVENMFHFSFLIKEGRAAMSIGEDELPYVHMPREVNEVGQSTAITKNQVIGSLNMADWRRAVEKFNITSAYFPRRQ